MTTATSSEDWRTVYVVGRYPEYEEMFTNNGWLVVDNIEDDADLVQFCGGADVSPHLYNEERLETTYVDPERDAYEIAMFKLAFESGCAIAGICRGAQFVHVMNGGRLWQDVNNHGVANGHMVQLVGNDFTSVTAPYGNFHVSSTHHQAMKEGKGELLLKASQSTQRTGFSVRSNGLTAVDVEAVYHFETNSLCYQPHPEYFSKTHPCQKVYFAFIDKLLFGLEVV